MFLMASFKCIQDGEGELCSTHNLAIHSEGLFVGEVQLQF